MGLFDKLKGIVKGAQDAVQPQQPAQQQQQRDPEDAGEMLIAAALERGWGQHATWVARLAGPIVAADEPGWAAEKVDELTYYQATRGD